MMKFLSVITHRLLLLVIASFIVFFMLNLLPGDPAIVMLGLDATPQSIAALHQQLGLDAPAIYRFAHWIAALMRGDAGVSYTYQTSVASLVAERIQITLPLVLIATAMSLLVGVPVGTIAAVRRGGIFDVGLMGVFQFFKAIPDFWLAMMLILSLSLTLHWFPAGGFPGWGGLLDALRALFLPALALALPQAAIQARFMRSSMIEVLSQDFIQTSRAQGYGRLMVLCRVAIPNAFIPVVTIVGIQIPILVTGSIIVENVFDMPGCGKLLLDAVNQRDIPVVQAIVMMLVTGVVVLDLMTELFVRWLDPRLGRATV